MSQPAYVATHRVPPTGLQAWATPDASQPAAADLAPNLDVQLVRWWGEWAEIRCSNGWTAWVGGRQLVPTAAAGPGLAQVQARLRNLPAGVTPLIAGGAALVVLGTFLPWLSASAFGVSVNASSWDVPFLYLVTGENTLSGLDIGLVLVLVGIAVVAVPLVTKRPLDAGLVVGAAGLVIATAVMFFLRVSVIDDTAGAGVGFGPFVSAGGGVLLAVAHQQARHGVRPAGGQR